jgi:hypothetical protein
MPVAIEDAETLDLTHWAVWEAPDPSEPLGRWLIKAAYSALAVMVVARAAAHFGVLAYQFPGAAWGWFRVAMLVAGAVWLLSRKLRRRDLVLWRPAAEVMASPGSQTGPRGGCGSTLLPGRCATLVTAAGPEDIFRAAYIAIAKLRRCSVTSRWTLALYGPSLSVLRPGGERWHYVAGRHHAEAVGLLARRPTGGAAAVAVVEVRARISNEVNLIFMFGFLMLICQLPAVANVVVLACLVSLRVTLCLVGFLWLRPVALFTAAILDALSGDGSIEAASGN